ncbi:hypothetical protein DFH28DRAFT_1169642 [Melampsora americana]|nr:hypothetical protein DFH28DRAFT_1169642 [Melampsora americana]
MSFDIITLDQVSITLIGLIISITLYNAIRITPQPSSYPILLGMQADLSRVRRKSESPIFRNTSFGMGMLALTPSHTIKSLNDIILLSNGKFEGLKTPLNPLPDEKIVTLVKQARQRILSILNDHSKKDDRPQHSPQVLILISNPYLNLIFSLAAADLPYHALHIWIPEGLNSIPVHIQQISHLQFSQLRLVICDDQLKTAVAELISTFNIHPKLCSVNDLVDQFNSNDLPDDQDITSQHELFTILSTGPDGNSRLISYSPEALLAGLTASLALIPKSKSVGPADRVAIQVEANPVYGFETMFAVTSIYGGATICFFNKIEELVDWHPTILVCQADLLEELSKEIRKSASKSLILKLELGRRLSYLSNGILIEGVKNQKLWIGENLRVILTPGPVTQRTANVVRAALGAQVQQVYAHPLVAGPILATMSSDFQSLGLSQEYLHYGPPTINVECKLVDVPEPAIINNDAVKGQLAVKGPTVAFQIKDAKTGKILEDQMTSEKFLMLDQEAQLLSNGTVKIFSSDLI